MNIIVKMEQHMITIKIALLSPMTVNWTHTVCTHAQMPSYAASYTLSSLYMYIFAQFT